MSVFEVQQLAGAILGAVNSRCGSEFYKATII